MNILNYVHYYHHGHGHMTNAQGLGLLVALNIITIVGFLISFILKDRDEGIFDHAGTAISLLSFVFINGSALVAMLAMLCSKLF